MLLILTMDQVQEERERELTTIHYIILLLFILDSFLFFTVKSHVQQTSRLLHI